MVNDRNIQFEDTGGRLRNILTFTSGFKTRLQSHTGQQVELGNNTIQLIDENSVPRFKAFTGGVGSEQTEIGTSTAAGSFISLRDSANDLTILTANQGGTVKIPNGAIRGERTLELGINSQFPEVRFLEDGVQKVRFAYADGKLDLRDMTTTSPPTDIIRFFDGTQNVEIPNGNISFGNQINAAIGGVTNKLFLPTTDVNTIFNDKIIATSDNYRIGTNNTGTSSITIKDRANAQDLAVFNEGGPVKVPANVEFTSTGEPRGGIAIGLGVTVDRENSVLVGDGATVSYNSVAVGKNADVPKHNGVGIGTNVSVRGDQSVGIGRGASSAYRSVAIGNGATSNRESIAIGVRASTGSDESSIAIGYEIATSRDHETVLGGHHINTPEGGFDALQQGYNPTDTITETTSPTGFTFSGTAERDIHDDTVVTLSNASGASVTEDVTVSLFDGSDATGTLVTTETQSITIANGASTTATFNTTDQSLDNGTFFIEVTTSGTALTVDQTDENTKGATYTFDQNTKGRLTLNTHDNNKIAEINPISGDLTFGDGFLKGNIIAGNSGNDLVDFRYLSGVSRINNGGGRDLLIDDYPRILSNQGTFSIKSANNVRLETGGSGTSSVQIYDTANTQEIARFSEGGNVQIPNGNLDLGGNVPTNVGPGETIFNSTWAIRGSKDSNYTAKFDQSTNSITAQKVVSNNRFTSNSGAGIVYEWAQGFIRQETGSATTITTDGADMHLLRDSTGDLSYRGGDFTFHQNSTETIATSGSGTGSVSITDTSNAQDLAVFREGGPTSIGTDLLFTPDVVELLNGRQSGFRLKFSTQFQFIGWSAIETGGADIELQNGRIDNTNAISSNSSNFKLSAKGNGDGTINIHDKANAQSIALFNEGGNVEIPNGGLSISGFLGASQASISGNLGLEGNYTIRFGSSTDDLQIRDIQNGNNIFNLSRGGNLRITNAFISGSDAVLSDSLSLPEISEPSAPSTGYKLYTDAADGSLKAKDSTGGVATLVSQ
jgi:hypothetical protein